MRAKSKFFTVWNAPFQSRFNGKNPECVTDALLMAQERVNKEHGGREVLSDIDILNLGLTLMGAGKSFIKVKDDRRRTQCALNMLFKLFGLN